MEIMEGETFVIMGLSGSGKSTLIRCLNLLNRPTSGAIYVDGENVVDYNKNQLNIIDRRKLRWYFNILVYLATEQFSKILNMVLK